MLKYQSLCLFFSFYWLDERKKTCISQYAYNYSNYVFRESNSKIITGIKRETINYFQITGWVPLHEAAWKGHKDCAVALLNWDAPAMPRSKLTGGHLIEFHLIESLDRNFLIK